MRANMVLSKDERREPNWPEAQSLPQRSGIPVQGRIHGSACSLRKATGIKEVSYKLIRCLGCLTFMGVGSVSDL